MAILRALVSVPKSCMRQRHSNVPFNPGRLPQAPCLALICPWGPVSWGPLWLMGVPCWGAPAGYWPSPLGGCSGHGWRHGRGERDAWGVWTAPSLSATPWTSGAWKGRVKWKRTEVTLFIYLFIWGHFKEESLKRGLKYVEIRLIFAPKERKSMVGDD